MKHTGTVRRRFSGSYLGLGVLLAASGCKDSDTPGTIGGPLRGDAGVMPDAAPPAMPSDSDAGPTNADETCWFEYLGDWVRCEESMFPLVESVPAESLQDCAAACLADDGCTAVVDYFWKGWSDYGCLITLGTCDDPLVDYWTEIDGGKEWRKVCGANAPEGAVIAFESSDGVVVDPASGCKFEGLVPPLACEDYDDPGLDVVTFASLDECFAACQEREDCNAVKHWPELTPGEFECELHLSTCDAPVDYFPEDPVEIAQYYQKSCVGSVDAGPTP